MASLVVILKALTEIALLLLLGQFVVALFSGARRDANVVYQLFRMATDPVVKITRRVTPRAVLDAHVPLVSFFMLLVLWACLTVGKIWLVRIAPAL